MPPATDYVIQQDILAQPLEVFDVGTIRASTEHPWFNQTLARVNDSLLRLGLFEGAFHWHSHPDDDELFFVLSGELTIELEGRSIVLGPGQGTVVPRGVRHRPLSPKPSVVLMIETTGIEPLGE
jgi:mannose-6-phosphate isomerase-like protein (cupin superfamily)